MNWKNKCILPLCLKGPRGKAFVENEQERFLKGGVTLFLIKTEGMSCRRVQRRVRPVLSLRSDMAEDSREEVIRKLSTNGLVLRRVEECGNGGRYMNLKRLVKSEEIIPPWRPIHHSGTTKKASW